jgi:hypothetical protein
MGKLLQAGAGRVRSGRYTPNNHLIYVMEKSLLQDGDQGIRRMTGLEQTVVWRYHNDKDVCSIREEGCRNDHKQINQR